MHIEPIIIDIELITQEKGCLDIWSHGNNKKNKKKRLDKHAQLWYNKYIWIDCFLKDYKHHWQHARFADQKI